MSEQTPSEYLRGLAQGKADMAGEISLLNAAIRQREAALSSLAALCIGTFIGAVVGWCAATLWRGL